MPVKATWQECLGPLARLVETVVPEAEFRERLEAGRPLRCKLGLDPTAPSLHVGNAIQFFLLRRLQDLGHQAVLILGDATAQVGDPSGKDKSRPVLSPEEIEAHLATWLEQIGTIIDLDRAEIRRNSEWFSAMSFSEVLGLTGRMTVQQMIERDSFQERLASRSPISVREFLYCLMQGWDSVVVRADVELGGRDQTFNLMVGRRLMEQEGLPPQVVLLTPLLEGIDGVEKMSKSLGNAIGLDDPPREKFGRAMRVADALLPSYLRLTTALSDPEIDRLLTLPNPMDAKLGLAQALVSRHHGDAEGTRQREEFLRVFRRGERPSDMAVVDLGPAAAGGFWVADLLRACGFASSTAEARRLIEGGGVHLNDRVIDDWRERIRLEGGEVLQVGRRRQARLAVGGMPMPAQGDDA